MTLAPGELDKLGTIEFYTGAAKAKSEVVEMGGPGSGHWRHAGRKGKRGGSAPSKGVVLEGLIPEKNLAALDLGLGGGIWGSKLKERFGESFAHGAMYNPKTDTLLVGRLGHNYLHQDYALDQSYDDFVKIHLGYPKKAPSFIERYTDTIFVYLDRHQARDTAEAWDKSFRAAKALKRAGVPSDIDIVFEYWEQRHGEEISRIKVGEI